MKITKFKKIGNDKYKIYLDNGDVISLYEDVIINNNLLIRKELDEKTLDSLIKENNNVNVYSMALNYISYKMRSQREVYDYLTKKDISKKLIEEVINKLTKNGYLNDYNFAKAYINDRLNLSNDGPLKIKNNLLNLGIKESIIDDTLENIDYNIIYQKLNKLINKKIKSSKGSFNMIKIKLLNYFYNLGYDKNTILEILNNISIRSDLSLLKKEYDKLIFKYSKKYEGRQLELFVEQKLYAKGYTKEEIQSIKKES